MSEGNPIPISSCMYSTIWTQKDDWIVRGAQHEDDFYNSRITTSPQAIIDGNNKEDGTKTRPSENITGPKEKNGKKSSRMYKHVPHKDKPVQVVAKRNARERRRVHAVNIAFSRLRKAVPIENSRGKRVSKVKTLQYAIDYIHNLQLLLEEDRLKYQSLYKQPLQVITQQCYPHRDDFFADFHFGGNDEI